ncbi:hypothetical protein Tco_1420925 [Tanacetum coccineum]
MTSCLPLPKLEETVNKVPDTKDTIRFKLDTQDIVYTVDIFCDTLKLPVETPENPFIAPVNIEVIQSYMQRVGYQGIVDKVSAFFTKFFVQPWQTIFEEDYHSIKDDIPLVSVYTTRNVTVRGMLIPDAFLTEEICATDDYKEYETVFVNIVVPMNQPQPGKKRKQSAEGTSSPQKLLKVTIKQKQVVEGEKDEESYADKFAASILHDDVDDSKDRIEPGSHKEHLEFVDDDDDETKEEKKDEKKDDEMGSLENKSEKMQTPIPTTPRSPKINLSSDKTIVHELMDIVSPSTPTTSKDPQKERRISSKYSHLPGSLRRMCMRQGYMIRDMQRKNLKRVMANIVIKERDAFQSENTIIQVYPIITTSTDTTSSADLQQQLYLKMKSNLQDQANDPALWDVLKRNFEKSSTSNTFCRDDDFHSQHHDDHQEDDAPPEGEKIVKRCKASKSLKSARGSSSKRSAKESINLLTSNNNINEKEWMHGKIETIMNEDEFRNTEEYAYHLEQATNFMENQMVWERRQEDIRRSIPKPLVFYGPQRKPNESLRITEVVRIITDQLYGLDFMDQILVMRENDKPDSFSEADFKYLNKNDIEDLYYLCWNKKVKVDEFLNDVHQKSCYLGESS